MSHYAIVLEIKKMLKNLDGWLDKAKTFAETKKFDVNTLLQSRLAAGALRTMALLFRAGLNDGPAHRACVRMGRERSWIRRPF